MLSRLSGVLNEAAMGYLALAALSLGLAPLVFALPRGVEQGFDVAEWVIIGLFALEYATNFALSTDRRKFALHPWRMLDAVIIVAALLSLLPAVSEAVRTTPALRILRLFRILLFGPRAGHGLQRSAAPPPRPAPSGQPQVTLLRPGEPAPRKCDWNELLQWAAAPTSDWLHASNLAPDRLVEIASAVGVPHVMIEAALHESSYPRIESGARWTALTVSIPSAGDAIHRDPVLLLVNRFMRLLAIVSTLTLIPVVAGGLLGMNLGDSPWPVTLGQVAFGTLVLMLGVLYTFMAKGWLR